MPDEKDRLGDTLRDKEKAEEDRYFAELSKRQMAKLRQAGTTSETMSCPRCGAAVQATRHEGHTVDACSKGCGWPGQPGTRA